MEPVSAALTAAELALKIWSVAEDQTLRERVIDFFREKGTIVVLGSTGVGKTNFLNSLRAASGIVDAIPGYTRTIASEQIRVRISDRPFIVIDTPGQLSRQSERLNAVRDALSHGSLRVINVVSYGYHEYATEATEALDSRSAPRLSFLERHRQTEISAMSEWLTLVSDRTRTKWVITVVTKADLWWKKHAEVVRWYESDEYNRILTSIDSNLRHAVLPYCSVFHKFFGQANLDGTFDDTNRIHANLHFLRRLVAMDSEVPT